MNIFFKLICIPGQVSPPEEVGQHLDHFLEPAFIDKIRQPCTGDNYIVEVGGEIVLEAGVGLFDNPLHLVAHDGAADFLRYGYPQPGLILTDFL